jgi:hypothetical protein
MDEYDMGEAMKNLILKIINKKILPKVTKEVCFETKLSAIDTLSKMSLFISELGDSEVEDHSIRGEVPEALCKAMVQIGEMLSEETARVAEQKEIVARAEEVTEFRIEFLDEKPFLNLTHFTGLFLDGSVPLDFSDCVNDVTKCLAKPALTDKQRAMQRMRHENTFPAHVVRTVISNQIYARVHRRSCIETKLNAIKALTKIGLEIVNASSGPHAGDFGDSRLDTLLTAAMLEIYYLESEFGDESFLMDEEFVEDITALSVAKGDAFSNLGLVKICLGLANAAELHEWREGGHEIEREAFSSRTKFLTMSNYHVIC